MLHRQRTLALLLLLPTPALAQNFAWVEGLGTPAEETLGDVVADDLGGAFSCGSTRGALAGTVSPAGWNGWIARHDELGQLVWTRQLQLFSGLDTRIVGAVTDSLGGVMVAGTTNGAVTNSNLGGNDAFIIRQLANGNDLGTWQFGTAEDDEVTATGSDGSRVAFVAGRTTLRNSNILINVWIFKHDLIFPLEQWNLGPAEFASIEEITATDDGGAYIVGVPAAQGQPLLLRRYDGAGQRVWTVPLDPAVEVHDVEADGEGGVFLFGTRRGLVGAAGLHEDVFLARYEGSGALLWSSSFGTEFDDQGRSLSRDPDGNLLLSGVTSGDIAGAGIAVLDEDAWVAKYTSAGTRIWIRQIESAGSDVASGVTTDGGGGAIVGGTTSGNLGGPNLGADDVWIARFDRGLEWRGYCLAPATNSTGLQARMDAAGDNIAAVNELTLLARQLPPNTFAIFLTSETQGFIAFPGGSQGYLCLGGAIGRFVAPGQILVSGPMGAVSLEVDLTALPMPTGFVPVVAGETWHFQGWYRDVNPAATSNYTDGLSILFR